MCPMPYYPVFLDIKGRLCLVIGGGNVAERKVSALIFAGAKVTVISPTLTKGLKKFVFQSKNKKIRHIPRRYIPGDIKGFFLAISATGSKKVNKMVYEDSRNLKILLNVADNPGLCDFVVPSVVKRGSLQIAISTGGKSPYLSKSFKALFEEIFPEELAVFTEILGAVRSKLLKKGAKNVKKLSIYNSFLNSSMLEWIREGSVINIDGFLKGLLGKGYTLEKLCIKL